MVAFNTRYLAELAGPGRLGFIATNGLCDCAVIDGEQEDEYRRRLREGWRIVAVRPICRSHVPKLVHTHPDLVNARAFSYTLVIMESPCTRKSPRSPPPCVRGMCWWSRDPEVRKIPTQDAKVQGPAE
jgi:hypothetical protein